jgi:hypothetical protein
MLILDLSPGISKNNEKSWPKKTSCLRVECWPLFFQPTPKKRDEEEEEEEKCIAEISGAL